MTKNYALITGSTAGIGLDIARELASRGHNILLTARREDRLKDIAERLTLDFGVHADYVAADLSEPSAPGTIFSFCDSRQYAVNILVNNAGYSINKKFHETGEEEEDKFLRVLGTGVVALTKRFIPGMLKPTIRKNYVGVFFGSFCSSSYWMGCACMAQLKLL